MSKLSVSNLSNSYEDVHSNFAPQIKLTSDANTVGLWHFDEGVGAEIFDSSPDSNTGTNSGANYSLDVPFGY